VIEPNNEERLHQAISRDPEGKEFDQERILKYKN